MDKPASSENKKKVAGTALAGSASIGVAVGNAAATGDLAAAILAALTASAGPTVAMLFQVTSTWGVRATERWWERTVQSANRADLQEEVERRILSEQANGRSPKTAGVIAASVRALLEGVDDEIVPVLASLSAEYLHEHRSVDHFFRVLVRTLVDMDARNLRDLRCFVRNCDGFLPPGVDLQQSDTTMSKWVVHQAHEEYVDHPTGARDSRPFDLEAGAELVALLKRHGLASESSMAFDRRSTMRCYIGTEHASRLGPILARSVAEG